MTKARLHEIEQLKRDELMRRAHEIVPELVAGAWQLRKVLRTVHDQLPEMEFEHKGIVKAIGGPGDIYAMRPNPLRATILKELNDQ